MTEAVQLAIIAVIASLTTGTIVVAVGVWADGRRKRSDASVAAQANEHNELVKVRMEYRDEIKALRDEIRSLRDRLDAKEQENRALSITVARQEARIGDLEADLAALHKAREARP